MAASAQRQVGVGLVGVGWMGELHSSAYRRLPEHYPDCPAVARLVIAADPAEQRARAATERLGYAAATTDWRAVVEHPQVEAVSITTPNHLHREVALACAEAGKHFWGEKPLGRFPHETAEVAAAAAGVRTVVGFNYRQVPLVRYVRELIAAGAIGTPTHFRSHFLADYSASPEGALSWRFLRAEAGLGVVTDLGTHIADMAQFLLGPVARVSAQQATLIPTRPTAAPGQGTHFANVASGPPARVENEDYVSALVEFATGVRGVVEMSRVAVGPHSDFSFEVNGTEGAVGWSLQRMNELRLYGAPGPRGDVGFTTVFAGPEHGDFARFQPGRGIPMGYADLKVIEGQVFMASVADGSQREPGVQEALEAARVVDAIVRSCDSGEWEELVDSPAPVAL